MFLLLISEVFGNLVLEKFQEHNRDVIMQQPEKLLSEMSLRFAFAFMTYSPPSVIPEELTSLPMSIFKLPEQVCLLFMIYFYNIFSICFFQLSSLK